MPSPDETFPIVDAHQHFWDLERNDYPWLHAAEPIAFRYGDYDPIRRTYLPDDYRKDMGAHRVVDRLVGSFDAIYSGFREAVADLALADQRKLFHDNAERIYRLAAETPAHGGHP
jgi:predicted TIM-barrel fold metal-dependent hydrolase